MDEQMQEHLKEVEIMYGSSEEEEIVGIENELEGIPIEQLPEKVDLDSVLTKIGSVHALVGQQIVIACDEEHSALDIGSLLVTEDRRIIGKVFDTFGPILKPFYVVYTDRTFNVGDSVFSVDAKIIELDKLKDISGEDATDLLSDEGEEFSDDEAEKNAKKKKKEAAKNKAIRETSGDYKILQRPSADMRTRALHEPQSNKSTFLS